MYSSVNRLDPSVARARLTNIYECFAPEKLGQIDKVLTKYEGREDELIAMVQMKYNLDENDEPISDQAQSLELQQQNAAGRDKIARTEANTFEGLLEEFYEKVFAIAAREEAEEVESGGGGNKFQRAFMMLEMEECDQGDKIFRNAFEGLDHLYTSTMEGLHILSIRQQLSSSSSAGGTESAPPTAASGSGLSSSPIAAITASPIAAITASPIAAITASPIAASGGGNSNSNKHAGGCDAFYDEGERVTIFPDQKVKCAAYYTSSGMGGLHTDVTFMIQNLHAKHTAEGDPWKFTPNKVLHDPYPMKKKKLKLWYTPNKVISESSGRIIFDRPCIRAFYAPTDSDSGMDVTQRLNMFIENNMDPESGTVQIIRSKGGSLNSFLGDPFPNQHKSLVLFTAKKDSSLSLAAQEELRKSFSLWDANGDGELDKSEAMAALIQHFPEASPGQLSSKFKEADTDGDGKLSFEEYCFIAGPLIFGDDF